MPDDVIKEDEATELAGLVVDRVDGVKGPATGQGWIVVKALNDQGQETEPEAQGSEAGARSEHLDAHGAANQKASSSNLDSDDESNEEAQGSDEIVKADDPDANPGDPAWEAKDAAVLRQAAQQLAAVSALVDQAYGRECAEADAGDTYDYADASDLDCAQSALGCALGIVARLSFTEGAEGAPIAKSDDLVSNTVAAMTNLLQQGSFHPEKDVESMKTDELQSMLAAQTEQLAKQFEERLDARLDAIEKPAADAPAEDVEKAEEPAPEPAPAPAADAEPVAKAEEVSNTSTTPNTDIDGEVLKSMLADVFKAALAEDGAFGSVVKGLEERIDKVERQPSTGGPLLRGAGGHPDNALVTLRDDPASDTPEMSQLRKSLDTETNAQKKAEIGRQLTLALARQFAGG